MGGGGEFFKHHWQGLFAKQIGNTWKYHGWLLLGSFQVDGNLTNRHGCVCSGWVAEVSQGNGGDHKLGHLNYGSMIPGKKNYFTSSDPHQDMLGGGCQVRVVIENMMGRMENLKTLISGFLGLVILVRWALVTMFLSWTTQTGCRIHRTYVSLIGSGEGRHTTHLLKCVLLLSTSQTDWKQSSDVLSWHIFWHSFWQIFWYIFWHSFWHIFWHSFWHLSDISFDILSDKSFTLSDISSDILSDISFDMLSDISSDILSDISKPKPNIHSFTQKAALQTLYLPHTTQQK